MNTLITLTTIFANKLLGCSFIPSRRSTEQHYYPLLKYLTHIRYSTTYKRSNQLIFLDFNDYSDIKCITRLLVAHAVCAHYFSIQMSSVETRDTHFFIFSFQNVC